MRFLRIDPESSVPAKQQIVDALRLELVEGHLRPGDRLPSVRRAAVDLGLHFNTVAEAFRQLASEGWLELSHGRNARVVSRQRLNPSQRDWTDYVHRLRRLVAEMRGAGVSEERLAGELIALARKEER